MLTVPVIYPIVKIGFITPKEMAVARAYKKNKPNLIWFTILSPRIIGNSEFTEFIKTYLIFVSVGLPKEKISFLIMVYAVIAFLPRD